MDELWLELRVLADNGGWRGNAQALFDVMSEKLGIVEALPPSAEQFWELLGMISGVLKFEDFVALYCIAHNGELTVDICPTGESVDFGPRGEAWRRLARNVTEP